MRVVQKMCIFGAISLSKIFIKICSHPKISWFFLWPLYFSWKNSVTPQLFQWPPHSEENDSPLTIAMEKYPIPTCALFTIIVWSKYIQICNFGSFFLWWKPTDRYYYRAYHISRKSTSKGKHISVYHVWEPPFTYTIEISRCIFILLRGVLSGKVSTGMCGPDRVLFGLSGLPMTPFLFEKWFRYRSHFCKMQNFQWIFPLVYL